ncbi:MAG TPA: endonuclease MutS2 [Persephonella sp.]|nr:endonuclease MutS2 [Persephonella sp.]
MREKDLKLLEFDKFLTELSKLTPNDTTKERILSLKPETDQKGVLEKINLTQEFIDILNKEGYIPLSEFPDISEPLELLFIQESVLTAQNILDIYRILKISRTLKNFLSEDVKNTEYLIKIYKNLYSSREIERIIAESIDESGMIKDTASRDLYSIRKGIKDLEKQIISTLERIINSQKYSDIIQERIVTVRRDRYVIPVKQNFSGRIKGIIQDRSSSGQTVYLEPVSVVELNNRLSDLKLKEQIEIRRILKFITDILRKRADLIKKSFETIIQIDTLYTIGKYSKEYRCRFPEISERFELIGAKHPVFLMMGKDFKPIDIRINRGVVITGPNTGGKTVALKTAGLSALLVQSGIPVPVEEGSMPVFEGIFADIGDMQSIEQNLSTFSAHILNIDGILKNATERSLVLLDELIPGTDPDEGSAIGIGVLEKLKKTGCYVMATTHFRQIKIYALSDSYFSVASVGFDREKLTPTYTLHYNSVGESMAFYIAEKLGFDQEILETAKKYINENYRRFEEALKELEIYKSKHEKELSEVEELKKELIKEKEKYASLNEKLEKYRKENWKIIREETENYIRSIREEGYRILQELKASGSGKSLEDFIKQKKKQINIHQEKTKGEEFNIGDRVRIKGKNSVGEVISIRENRANINFNGIKIWVDISDIEKVNEEKKEKKTRFSFSRKIETTFRPEINLIGKTKDQAVRELEHFIDRAVVEGFSTLRIIHGYGSGVLRKAVRDYLDKLPYRIDYEDAPYNEGGMGVTIVHIK